MDSDGYVEVAVGAEWDDDGGTNRGAVWALTLDGCAGFTISDPEPGLTGQVNLVNACGATPFAAVVLMYGFRPGSTSLQECPALTVPIRNAEYGPVGSASGNGTVTLQGFVPLRASGKTIYMQAVDLAGCAASNLVIYTFP